MQKEPVTRRATTRNNSNLTTTALWRWHIYERRFRRDLSRRLRRFAFIFALLGDGTAPAPMIFNTEWPRWWFKRAGVLREPNLPLATPKAPEAIAILRKMADEGRLWGWGSGHTDD